MHSTLFIETLKLSDEIEEIRSRMVGLGIRYGFLHPEVQFCSRQLDKLLVRYYRLTGRSSELAPVASALEETRV